MVSNFKKKIKNTIKLIRTKSFELDPLKILPKKIKIKKKN
jgi:hypothetical protein